MKKIYSNTKLWAVFMMSLLLSASFYSCDKDNAPVKDLKDTFWREPIVFCDPPDVQEDHVHFFEYKGTISIDFATKDEADIIANFDVHEYSYEYTEYGERVLGGWGGWKENHKGTATYTYKGNEVSIRIRWRDDDAYDIDNGRWTGTVNGNEMNLRNVFGQNVTFFKY